jgi:DnaJ family protein A protein 2
LFTDIEIDLLTALAGGHFSLQHLDDRALRVAIRPGEITKHGKNNRLCSLIMEVLISTTLP